MRCCSVSYHLRASLLVALAGCGRVGFGPSSAFVLDAITLNVQTFPITSAAAVPSCPRIEWTNSDLRVVWKDFRGTPNRYYYARIDTDGTILTPEVPFGASGNSGIGCPGGPIWNGSVLAVGTTVYVDNSYVDLLDMNGAVTAEAIIGGGPGEDSQPIPAWNGSQFGVAYFHRQAGASEVRVTTVSASGVASGTSLIKTQEPITYELVKRGTGFALITDTTIAPSPLTYFDLDLIGATLAQREVLATVEGTPNRSLAHDGTRYAIAIGQGGRVALLLGDVTIAPTPITYSFGAEFLTDVRVITVPSGFVLSWADSFTQYYVTRVDSAGMPMGPVFALPTDLRLGNLVWAGDQLVSVALSGTSSELVLVTVPI